MRTSEVVQAGLALPGVTVRDYATTSALRAGGASFAWLYHDLQEVTVRSTDDEVLALGAMDPATYRLARRSQSTVWVRIRLATAEREEVLALLDEGRRLLLESRGRRGAPGR